MFDMVMTVVCEGLGNAGLATEASVAGDFAAASRYYRAAAGVFHFLAHTQLPTWSAKGSNVSEETLPVECSVHVAEAMEKLFIANAQQMAVATVLIKPGVPNYGLLGKLCLGISDELDKFVTKLRKEAFKLLVRIDKDIFALISFQVALQKALSLYFQSRALWEKGEYGIAISLLSQATVELKNQKSGTGTGVPDVNANKTLKPLATELTDLRDHMNKLLHSWEKDNSSVYFEHVPQQVPADKKLQEGLVMGKMEPYTLVEVEPVLLILPGEGGDGGGASRARPAVARSDSDIARDLQRRLNEGLDI
jgi:BRO1-like domain